MTEEKEVLYPNKKSFQVHNTTSLDVIKLCTVEEIGLMFYNLVLYNVYGEEPEPTNDRFLDAMWSRLKTEADILIDQWLKSCEQSRNAVNTRWERERAKRKLQANTDVYERNESIQANTDVYEGMRELRANTGNTDKKREEEQSRAEMRCDATREEEHVSGIPTTYGEFGNVRILPSHLVVLGKAHSQEVIERAIDRLDKEIQTGRKKGTINHFDEVRRYCVLFDDEER